MSKSSRPAAAPSPRPPVISLAEARKIRASARLARGVGPSPERIQAAVQVYVSQFDFWYTKQWTSILDDYVERMVRRANPYVRRTQHGDCSPTDFAEALVSDWDSRNFVTAGGQALEAMAIAIGEHCKKAAAEGVDIERRVPADPSTVHLYVVKSGAVTRNTDIVGSMKKNLRAAGKRLMQNHGIKNVVLNYATCVGTTNSTMADGVLRPSSARFWSEITDVGEAQAMSLVWGVTEAAASSVSRPTKNRAALVAQVASYVEDQADKRRMDWAFLVKTVSEPTASYRAEHERRDKAARERGAAIMGSPSA